MGRGLLWTRHFGRVPWRQQEPRLSFKTCLSCQHHTYNNTANWAPGQSFSAEETLQSLARHGEKGVSWGEWGCGGEGWVLGRCPAP